MTRARVTAEPLDVLEHERAVASAAAGATVVFTGVVRDVDHGRQVSALEYHGHPNAAAVLEEIVAEFEAREPVLGIAVSHRVGDLAIGDVALVAAISTRHRADAFAVCAELVDAVKSLLPIWKRQLFTDGTDEWVNCP